jgi:putative nucleotidyltransferase-like protein
LHKGHLLNFITVTEQLITAFRTEGIRYALIGGYAVGLWGVARSTVDMDFLVLRDDLGRLDTVMERFGYRLHHRTDNVSHFVSAGPFGSLDFLHAFRSHSLHMLERAVEKPLFGGAATVRVLIPEDLIALKIQAIANNPARERLDLNDIEELLRLHGKTLDWELLEEYFDIFERHDLFVQLREKYHAPD